jgi:hypothetical protein
MPEIRDAIVIDEGLENLVVDRLAEVPDEPMNGRLLFAFLDERASDTVFRKAITEYPAILMRKAYASPHAEYDPKVRTHARALRLGVLPEGIRTATGERLEAAIFDDQDTSFLEDDLVLALIAPTILLRLPQRIRDEFLGRIPAVAKRLADEADPDVEPEDYFDDLKWALKAIIPLVGNGDVVKKLIDEAEASIANATDDLRSRKEDAGNEPDYEWDWHQNIRKREPPQSSQNIGSRSIFSDVDE